MEKQKIGSFDKLNHGDKIISPIDSQVTEFYIGKEGDKYLSGKKSLFPIFQFDSNDFYFYDGNKETGEIDNEYFR